MTRERAGHSRCINFLDSGNYNVKIGFAKEAGKPTKTLYVGIAKDLPTARKLRDVAEICRDYGRETGAFTSKAEIMDVWAICESLEADQ